MTQYFAETMTYQGANRLKNKLEHVWQNMKGPNSLAFAKARVVCQTREGGHDLYCVRSNVTFDKLGYPMVDQREHLDVHGWTW